MPDPMAAAIAEARASVEENGLPIGSSVARKDRILGLGRNRFCQTGDPTSHAEMEAIRDVARRATGDVDVLLNGASIYTTMMPCEMCAGAIIRFGIGRVVVAETRTYTDPGTRQLLERQGITVEVSDEKVSIDLVEDFCAR
ncbi:MAG TPA: nucleoside deaminase, partial [Gammaproteobacteria bacterium]|nr:nucleoside deaminase [Gammaproteobacteria bacterium]